MTAEARHKFAQLVPKAFETGSEAIKIASDPAQQSRAGCAAPPDGGGAPRPSSSRPWAKGQRWPVADPTALVRDACSMAIQIKGEVNKPHSKLIYLAS